MSLSEGRFSVLAAFLLALQPVTLPGAADAGRNTARCFQACHQLRVACDTRCDEICISMFPDGDEKYFDCLISGKMVCLEFEQEYRQLCQGFKSDGPIEP